MAFSSPPNLSMEMVVKQLPGDISTGEAVRRTALGVERGIRVAIKYILFESLNIVPIDSGDLASSAFTRLEGFGFNSIGVVGYTADYAVYVHEDMEAAHGEIYNAQNLRLISSGKTRPRRPQERAKFLQWVLENRVAEISAIIESEILNPGSSASHALQALTGLNTDFNAGALAGRGSPFDLL